MQPHDFAKAGHRHGKAQGRDLVGSHPIIRPYHPILLSKFLTLSVWYGVEMITCVFDRATVKVNDLSSGIIRLRYEQTSLFPSLREPKRECPSSSRRPGPNQP